MLQTYLNVPALVNVFVNVKPFLLEVFEPAPPLAGPSSSTSSSDLQQQRSATGLDILHATSAALFHALNELLVDSDFENAMKALTSYIPIKDEDMLMRVTKAEWKLHRGASRGSKKKS